MSDRYETPSWSDEPEELGETNPVTTDAPQPVPDDADLDASSENVFAGWPVAEPGPSESGDAEEEAEPPAALTEPALSEPAVSEPALSEPAVEEEAEEESEEEAEEEVVAAPLADHVSASSEHAPGDLTVPPGYSILEGAPTGERRAVGIVVARFNGDVTTRLLESALAELDSCGVSTESITVMPVPGAFELPLAAMALAKTRRFACIVALGCVIRGDTPHFDYVSSEAASGLQLAAIETGVPVAFGVLTLDRIEQAESRSGKGAEAVRTALEMADVFANLRAAAAR